MTAVATVTQVLDWCLSPDGPAPRGSLARLNELASSLGSFSSRLELLHAAAAGRLGEGWPPFGDSAPIAPDAIFVAAAVAGRDDEELVEDILLLTSPQLSMATQVAVHAVAEPAVAAIGNQSDQGNNVVNLLLRTSPLSRLLTHCPDQPPRISEVRSLMARPGGSRCVVTHFSSYCSDPTTLRFRRSVLETLRADLPDFVLDVFEAAMTRQQPIWIAALRSADEEIRGALTAEPSETALETVRFFGPLHRINRDKPNSVPRTTIEALRIYRALSNVVEVAA